MTEMEAIQSENQARIIREEIQDSLEKVNDIQSEILPLISTARTFGKTIAEWEKEFTLPISADADPQRVKYYCSVLSQHLEVAYRNLRKIKVLYSNYKLSYNSALNDKVAVQANNRGRKVAPALETMTRVAESQLGDRALVEIQYKCMIDFWQNMVFKVKDQVDIVKTIGMSNGTSYKIGEF